MKKFIKMLNKKRLETYQKQLMRKPRYFREVKRVFPIILTLILVFDLIMTNMAADSYIKRAFNVLEDENAVRELLVDNDHVNLDFNQTEVIDGNVFATIKDIEERKIIDYASGNLDFQMILSEFSECNNQDNGIFDDFYKNYIGKRDNKRYEITLDAHNALYNANGHLIAGQKNDIFQFVTYINGEEDRMTYYYRFNVVEAEKTYPGLLQEIFDKTRVTEVGEKNIDIFFKDIYIKGIYAIPKTIELRANGELSSSGEIVNFNPDSIGETVAIYDLSECDFSGYEYVDASSVDIKKIWNPMLYYIGDDYNYQLYKELTSEDINRNIQKLLSDEGYGHNTDFIEITKFKLKAYCWKATGNETLFNVTSIDCDFFRDWKEILLIFYSLSLLLTVCITLICARIRYSKKHLSYVVDSYRRKTTNAMAHDLKSPLMAISGYAENIVNYKEPEKTEYYAKTILESVNDMNRMIGNILELSQLEDATFALKKDTFLLDELVQERLKTFELKMEEKGLTVNLSGSASIVGDINWMARLLDNLLSNALRYGKEDSEIEIEISENELVICNIFDYTIAVEPDQLLEAFVRGDNARSNTQGNGLGLGIAKNIANAHGFQMFVNVKNNIFEVKLNF